mgnify:FL=1
MEDAIYVAPGAERRGVGKLLLSALVDAAARAGFRQMIALISSGAGPASQRLHASLGFAMAGRITAGGFKNGQGHDIGYMQRELGAGSSTSPA